MICDLSSPMVLAGGTAAVPCLSGLSGWWDLFRDYGLQGMLLG